MYGTAQSAVNDLRTFCDRNPETCVSGQNAVNVLVQKAQYGAQMIMALVDEHSGDLTGGQRLPGATPASNSAMPANDAAMPVPSAVPLEPLPWEQSASQNTLSPQDLEADWGGPDV